MQLWPFVLAYFPDQHLLQNPYFGNVFFALTLQAN